MNDYIWVRRISIRAISSNNANNKLYNETNLTRNKLKTVGEYDHSIQKYREDFQEILNDFPEYKNLIQIGYSGVSDNLPITGVGVINTVENLFYNNTDYFYKGNDLSFLHFTSLKALLSILSSQSIRLRTLNGVNDVNEINYVAKEFNINEEEVKKFQKEIFSFSLVKYSSSVSGIDVNTNNLDLWRFYGLNGDGVAIKFKILNNPLTWKSFHMSSILYGEENAKKLKAFKARIDLLNSKYPAMNIRLTNMFSFHKSNHFRNEDEVRLIFNTYLDRNNEHKFHTWTSQDGTYTLPSPPIKINNSESYFITVPLTKKENKSLEDSFFNTSPQLIVEEIILGYKFKEEELNLYRNVFRSVIEYSGGLEIEPKKIYITALKDLFRG